MGIREEKDEGPFVTGSTGLRDVRLDAPQGTTRARLRYIPLAVLALLVVLATIVGLWARHTETAGLSEALVGDARPEEQTAACLPTLDQGLIDPEFWSSDSAAAAGTEFAARIEEDPVALQGKDGMVFLSDIYSSNISQAVGRVKLTNEGVTSWLDYFAVLRYELGERDVDLLIVPAPAKWDVYPQFLPEWAQAMRGQNSLDTLLEADATLPFVDVRVDLRASETMTYGSVNSHWNPYGAYTAWNRIVQCLLTIDKEKYSTFEVPTVTQVTAQETLSEFADQGIGSTLDWYTPELNTELPAVVDLTQLPYEASGSGQIRTMLVRDSMGGALGPFFEYYSSWSIQLDNDFDTGENRPDIVGLADMYGVDLVVVEFAERYLEVPPVL